MIWFDLDNTPHVPLFRYIFKEFELRGIDYFVTARDFAQTKELLQLFEIDNTLIGKHAGKNKIKKIVNLFLRAHQLEKVTKGKHINLAVSHGSRTQLLTTKKRNIPSILMMDYEYTESRIFNTLADHILVPKFIPDERLSNAGFNLNKVIRYGGFKEEIYLKYFAPDNNFRKSIDITDDEILIVIRPPSMVGNYHDSRSENYLVNAIKYLQEDEKNKILIVNRTSTKRKFIESHVKFKNNVRFLEKSVDGLQLLYAADVSISGGGTMNRESALLGTKTYSIFTGGRPYLDEYLEQIGRLKFINSVEDIYKIEPNRIHEKKILINTETIIEELIYLFLEISNKRGTNL